MTLLSTANVLLFAVFVAGLFVLWFLLFKMLGQVNRILPPPQRFRNVWWPWEWVEVRQQHRRLYPSSKLRHAYWFIGILWLPFALLLGVRIAKLLSH